MGSHVIFQIGVASITCKQCDAISKDDLPCVESDCDGVCVKYDGFVSARYSRDPDNGTLNLQESFKFLWLVSKVAIKFDA